MDQAQLRSLTATTRAFIDNDPTRIALVPFTVQKGPNGNARVAGTARPLQTFKVIRMSASQKPSIQLDGVVRVADVTLVGMPGTTVDVYDRYTDEDGATCEVVSLVPYEGYQVKALVERRG